MLDDMIANAVENYDNPRKHVTWDDRFKVFKIDNWKIWVTFDGYHANYDFDSIF